MEVALCMLSVILGNPDPSTEITVRIGSGSIEIAGDSAQAEKFRGEGVKGGGILLVCKTLQVQRDASSYVVLCTDVKLITAAGVTGIAKQAQFDLKKNVAMLSGAQGAPVQLVREAEGDEDVTRITAQEVELNLGMLKR